MPRRSLSKMPPIPDRVIEWVVADLVATWPQWEAESGHQCWSCGHERGCTCMAYLQWPKPDLVARVAIESLYRAGIVPRTQLLPGRESA